jgi:enterochelin esterase-like enzyme
MRNVLAQTPARKEEVRMANNAAGDGPPQSAGREFVTETLDYDGGRQVTAYLPRDDPAAVVFAGDGQWLSQWTGSLDSTDVPPTLIVGVHGVADDEARLKEYSPVFDAPRFEAHEAFFVHEVARWSTSRFGIDLPAERTAVFGYSAGGELALALGLRHPHVFGAVIAGSPGGGFRPPDMMPTPLPRVYLFGGTREPFFLDNARAWALALQTAGAQVALSEKATSHGDPLWHAEFPQMLQWAFGPAFLT